MAGTEGDGSAGTKAPARAAGAAQEPFRYERYTAQQQTAAVEDRLTSLESTHYGVRLDVIVARDPGTVRSLGERAADLEKQILDLRAERDALPAETPS